MIVFALEKLLINLKWFKSYFLFSISTPKGATRNGSQICLHSVASVKNKWRAQFFGQSNVEHQSTTKEKPHLDEITSYCLKTNKKRALKIQELTVKDWNKNPFLYPHS